MNKANTDCVLLQHSRSTRYLLMWFGQEMVSKTNTHCMLLLHSVEEAIANCCGPTGDLSRVLNLTHREEYTHTHTQRTHIDFKANLCCRVPRSQRRATHTNTHTYTHTTHSYGFRSRPLLEGASQPKKGDTHKHKHTHVHTHTHNALIWISRQTFVGGCLAAKEGRHTHKHTHVHTHNTLIWVSKQTFVGGCLAAKEG